MPKTKPVEPLTRSELKAADKVVRRLTDTNFPTKTKVSLLPSVADIFDTDDSAQDAMSVLEKGHEQKEQSDALNKEYTETKLAATAIAVGAGIEGYRWGNLAVTVSLTPGRITLDRDLLRGKMVDAGVDPTQVGQILEDSMKQGEPFYTVKFEKVSK